MSPVNYYYKYDEQSEFYIPTNISLFNHYADLLYSGDGTRVVYASNDYTFRARKEQINKADGSLDLPYLNFRRTDLSFAEDWQRWSHDVRASGMFIPEISEKVKLTPIRFDFEGSVISGSEHDNYWAFKQLMNDNSLRTIQGYDIFLNNVPIKNTIELYYDSIDYDPRWNENDYLTQNRMFSVGFTCHVHTFMTEIDAEKTSWSITEKLLFDFAAKNNQDVSTYEEALQFAVNFFDETVTEITT